MGYFKNQLIAEQIEVGDRIPDPIPAKMHVAYPKRKTDRLMSKITSPITVSRRVWRIALVSTGLCGLLAGFLIGVVI